LADHSKQLFFSTLGMYDLIQFYNVVEHAAEQCGILFCREMVFGPEKNWFVWVCFGSSLVITFQGCWSHLHKSTQ